MTILANSHPTSRLHWNFFLVCAFIYFLTLSMDLISIDIGFFKLKLSHVIASIMFLILVCCKRAMLMQNIAFTSFVLILSSIVIASFFSPIFTRSFGYSLIYIFTFCVYFVVPFSLMYYFDEEKILNLYLISFFCIGSYAFLQFFCSLFGFVLPFSVHKIVFVRGSAFAHEPSFYALYAIPIVFFINAKHLFVSRKKTGAVLVANLFLLVSTATTAFFSYLVFFLVLMFFRRHSSIKVYFQGLRKKLLKISIGFVLAFSFVGIWMAELFKKTFLKFIFFGFAHESFKDRFMGIVNTFKVFLEHPLFGVGLGGVGPLRYRQEVQQLSELDRYEYDLQILEPTNVLTEVLGCLGLFGCIGFVLLLFLLRNQFRAAFTNPNLTNEHKVNALAFLISIIVMLICLQVNQGLFRSYIWVHIGLAMGYILKIQQNGRISADRR